MRLRAFPLVAPSLVCRRSDVFVLNWRYGLRGPNWVRAVDSIGNKMAVPSRSTSSDAGEERVVVY